MCTIHEDHNIYNSWNIKYDRQKFSSFWAIFLLFQPLNNVENQNFYIKRKAPEDIIILHICIINDKHMMYGSWDIECIRQFFVILNRFLPFYPSMDPENQTFLKMDKTPEGIVLQMRYSHLFYGSWDTECRRQNILLFWAIFCPFGP